ncbi:MAG: hypothetical protein P8X95_22225 [Anaerolineales bacterium]
MPYATSTPGKPYIQPLDAAQPLGDERKRWLLFRGLTQGKKAVSLQYPDTRCDYSGELFQEYLERTGVSGQNYRIPVDVVETERDDEPVVEARLYTTLVPVAPVRFIRPKEPGTAFPVERDRNLAPLREGWLYLFLDGYLWREIQVRITDGARPVFADVNLTRYQGCEERPATVDSDTRVLLPYRVGDESKSDALQVCYAEQQWSWSYICRMGGLNPTDPRFIEELHTGEHYKRDYKGIKVDATYRRQRMQSVNLHDHWIAGGENGFSIWDSFVMDLDTAVEKEGQNQYRIDRKGEIPVLALHDPLAIARDLAAAHQVAWGGLRTLVKLVTGELNDAEQGATQNDFSSKDEYEKHSKYVFEMRQRQASHQVSLLAKAYFLNGKPPEVDPTLTGEAAEAQKEAAQQFNYMRNNIDPEKIRKILMPDERAKQRELLAQTKAALVEYLLAGEDRDDPAHFTTVLAEQCTLEGDRIILPYETLTSLLPHLGDRPIDLDGILDGNEREAEADADDPGVTYVLRLLGRHPSARPLRLAGCFFPNQEGDDPENLYTYKTSPVPKGLPQFDPNRWIAVAGIGKKAGNVLANLFEHLAKAEHRLKKLQTANGSTSTGGAAGAAGKGSALMPLFRLAFVSQAISVVQIEIPLGDYLAGRLPPEVALFRAEMMRERLQAHIKKQAKLADNNTWRIPMETLQGQWSQSNSYQRQGNALMEELRLFDGHWDDRFSQPDPELAHLLESEKIKVLVTYEEEVTHLFDDATEHLTWHYKRVLTLTGFVAGGGAASAGSAQSAHVPRPPQAAAPSAPPTPPTVPRWYQKPGMTRATRYSILAFSSTFELWNLGMAFDALKNKFDIKYKNDKTSIFLSREMYDFLGAVADTSALGLQWAQTARIAAVGWDEAALLQVAKKVKTHQLANAGRMPALSVAEKTTWGTLRLVTWATRINLTASVISFFDSGYDAILAIQNRDWGAALGAGVMTAGFGVAMATGFLTLKGMASAGTAGALVEGGAEVLIPTLVDPLAWVAVGLLLIGAGIYFTYKKDRLELWLHHSPIAWDNPESDWGDHAPNTGDHAYWNEKPGLMLAEFLDLMVRPQIRFSSADSGTGVKAVIEVHYPYFIPGVSEAELEWGYVHENQLNPGERLSRAEPEDWNLALKNQLIVQLEKDEQEASPRVRCQKFHLPVAVGRFRIAARLRFHPYGRDRQVAGSEIALPEPARDDEGIPKENDGGWLKAESEGHRSGDSVWVYPVGFYGEPMGGVGGA